MNNTNRRGFLSGCGAFLASLPLVGALFGKAEADQVEAQILRDFDDGVYDREISKIYANPLFGYEGGYRLIRWIPVEERLPDHPSFSESRPALVAFDCGTVAVLTVRHDDPRAVEFYRLMKITHWAELPSPPTDGNGKA